MKQEQSKLKSLGIDPTDFTQWERWRRECLDFWFFLNVVMPEGWTDRYRDLGTMHKKIARYLTSEDSRRLYLSAFRGSLKTTILKALFVWKFCWSLARKVSFSIVYNTATKDNAHMFRDDVRHNLLNNWLLQWIFRELPSSDKDYDDMNKKRIRKGEAIIDFAALEIALVSRHYPNWVNDDLENEINTRTSYSRRELNDKWRYQKAVLTKHKKRNVGYELEVGTPFHHEGLNWKLRGNPTYDKMEIPCWRERKGKRILTWPELYTEEDFLAKKADMGSSIFSAQYLLKPVSEEDALARPNHIKVYRQSPVYAWRVVIIDPGGADPKKHDPTGVLVADIDKDGDIFLVYARKEWLSSTELMSRLTELKREFNPDDIRIEKEKYGTTIADIYQHRFPSMNISFVEHKGRPKEIRIWRLRQWFENMRINFPSNGKADEIAQDAQVYTGEESIEHDDLLDCLGYVPDVMRVPTLPQRHRLPSGRIFEPNIEESFEKEYDDYLSSIKNKLIDKERYYDSIY